MILTIEPMSKAYKSPEKQAYEWEGVQRRRERATRIRRGEKALIVKASEEKKTKKKVEIKNVLTVKELFKYHVSFVNEHGMRQSFSYQDAHRMLAAYDIQAGGMVL